MPVPKRKTSKSRRDKRSANDGIKRAGLNKCQTCGKPISTHQVCQECGYYKGKKILRTKEERMKTRVQKLESQEVKQKAKKAVDEPKDAIEAEKDSPGENKK